MHIQEINLTENTFQDLLYICNGVLAPLNGFMNEDDYRHVVQECCLANGCVFPLPITLEIPCELSKLVRQGDSLTLNYKGEPVGKIVAQDCFEVTDEDIFAVYGTLEEEHPGVREERRRSPYRIGGRVQLIATERMVGVLNPADLREIFQKKGFHTVAGFQTRNPIHRAHEYLQRCALEVCDGLFINPIVGWKKAGDFNEAAVMAAYDAMLQNFFPSKHVHIQGLRTQMRYAGPREAVFHAILRRNLGCTHFIIGRDHAGVGHYYSDYAAHDLAKKLRAKYDLGIEILLFREPYYCLKCGQVVTDKTCSHAETHKLSISGTKIRQCLSDGAYPDSRMMRPEIADAICAVGKENLFVEG